jgi:hypothetical protein
MNLFASANNERQLYIAQITTHFNSRDGQQGISSKELPFIDITHVYNSSTVTYYIVILFEIANN